MPFALPCLALGLHAKGRRTEAQRGERGFEIHSRADADLVLIFLS